MSVRFILGRAGAGKTHHCLGQIAEQLEDPTVEEPRLFLLVPEQASLQMERALLEWPGLSGFARCEVLSFRRLAHRVLAACGGGVNTISPTGRLMIVRRLVDQHARQLTVLRSERGRRGLIDRLNRTLDELIEEEVSPDDLSEACRQIASQDDALAARLRDVHLIYQAYLDRLGDEMTDPGHHLAIVRERLDAYPALRGALIWVDGFAGLTRQELRLLVALAERAERMEITLLMDPDSEVVQADEPVESFGLFARTERTYVGLRRALHAAGVEAEAPFVLGGPSPRFDKSPVMARLERNLFLSRAKEATQDDPSQAPRATIRLVQAATRRVEVAAVVAQIQRLVRRPDAPMRYRDISVIVRDLDPYHDLLTAALTAAGIPHFIDRRRPIAHHALVELVRSAIDVARHVGIEPVSTFIKTGLVGLDDADAHLLENYMRAHGITDRSRWVQGDWVYRRRPSRVAADDSVSPSERADLARLNVIRQRLVAALEPWWELADAPEPPAAEQWARGLFDLLRRFDVPRQITAWADQADQAGRLDEAEEHRQVWAHLVGLLDDLSGTFGDDAMSVSEFAEVVDTALTGSTLGLTPPTLDQVLVGSIERSRHPSIRAAWVLGFGEGQFPRRPSEDPILSDDHRRDLAKVGVELAPTSRQHLFDEKLLAYIAMTRPSERLWISWFAAEEDGKVCHPSPFVQAVRAVFPELRITQLAEPASARQTWAIATPDDLAAAVAADLRARVRQPTRSTDDDRRWNALYEWARQEDGLRDRLRRALGALQYTNQAALSADAVERLYGDDIRTSVSRVEAFAACPFKHFAAHSLGLEPRAEWELGAVDLGLLYHRILEEYLGRLIAANQRLDDVPPDELAASVRDLSQQALGELVDELIVGDARNAYRIDHGNDDLIRALETQRIVAAAGEYRPAGVEVHFGLDVPSGSRGDQVVLPPLEIVTPAGRVVKLRGKIDRIDLAERAGSVLASVVDYKRSQNRTLKLDRVHYGLDLQLLSYLLVVADHGEKIAGRPVEPSGAFYATLLDEVRRLDGPPESPPEEVERYRELRPRGVFDYDDRSAFDAELEHPSTISQVVSARVKKDGSPSHLNQTDVAEHAAFGALLRHVRRRIGELCDRMVDGVVTVEPYRIGQEIPCTYCPYQAVCRFEFDAHRPTLLRPMKRTDVLAAVCPSGEEGDDA